LKYSLTAEFIEKMTNVNKCLKILRAFFPSNGTAQIRKSTILCVDLTIFWITPFPPLTTFFTSAPLAIPIISEGKKYWIKGFLKKLNPIIRGGGEAYSTFAYCLTSRAIDIAAIQSLLRK